VREHQRLARGEMRGDGVAIELGLFRIWRKNHDYVGPGGGLAGRVTVKPSFCALEAEALPGCKPTRTETPLSRSQALGVTLRNRSRLIATFLALNQCEVAELS